MYIHSFMKEEKNTSFDFEVVWKRSVLLHRLYEVLKSKIGKCYIYFFGWIPLCIWDLKWKCENVKRISKWKQANVKKLKQIDDSFLRVNPINSQMRFREKDRETCLQFDVQRAVSGICQFSSFHIKSLSLPFFHWMLSWCSCCTCSSFDCHPMYKTFLFFIDCQNGFSSHIIFVSCNIKQTYYYYYWLFLFLLGIYMRYL